MIEMDESEGNLDKPVKWWELLDNTETFIRFHYSDIMEHGSDELKNAVEIILGGHKPGVYTKEA
ncbi:hypothetical protein [Paenibacillus qinlingensis]|uniref:Uncharacterized protein n=1 Tax=Paenibacillus qinlingensis TaxID=1837343 RepID=A0ABU1P8A0_9BACL|nr:hypothetical protein [Paenibacillus qinlingensis]MDR6555422.1 hypothetical protein [Paenibacillus qinlingensis]